MKLMKSKMNFLILFKINLTDTNVKSYFSKGPLLSVTISVVRPDAVSGALLYWIAI